MMLTFALFLKCILYSVLVKGEHIEEETLRIDIGTNVTLPCKNTRDEVIRWEKKGKISKRILLNGDLFLSSVQKNDSGLYQCTAREDEILSKIRLIVNTPPAALKDVIIVPSTVYALIRWESVDDGGYPITNITISYKEVNSVEWHYSHPAQPNKKKVELFELKPNSSYLFQIWASNKLGRGEVTNITAKTLHNKQEIELARHLLQGVGTFDTRIWLVAVAVMMATLLTLTLGICLVTCCDWQFLLIKKQNNDDPERIELIPNIIVNPGCGVEDEPHPQIAITDEDDEGDEELTTVYFACRNGAKAIDV